MSYFNAKMHQFDFGWGYAPDPVYKSRYDFVSGFWGLCPGGWNPLGGIGADITFGLPRDGWLSPTPVLVSCDYFIWNIILTF